MVHCAPLLGYADCPGMDIVEKNFMYDLKALVYGEVDAIMIENNYDIPHYEKARPSTVPHLTDLCIKARAYTKKPLGLCVLWNDYETALSIAKIANFQFVRIPVFVDKVETEYGIFDGKAKNSLDFRKEIDAEHIMIYADVQVKHAIHLKKRSLSNAVRAAVLYDPDGIIITGKWTGDPPTSQDVVNAKNNLRGIPLILGSGVTPENIHEYDADGMIVGTYFKNDKIQKNDRHNIYPWQARIQQKKVNNFMNVVKKQRK